MVKYNLRFLKYYSKIENMIYDKFQEESIEYIKQGISVIVSAPTGAGKTVIAEYVINECLARGEKVIYTAPIKALSNQKYRDFKAIYKEDKIGIITGDVNLNPDAQVLIMTTEIFRNKILGNEASLSSYSWIIFDEIHYIDNYERGTVWEESLIFLPRHMRILALSATIPNIDEFAGWLQAIHKRPLKIVEENNRPVPLHFLYQCQNKILDKFHELASLMRITKKNKKRKNIPDYDVHLKQNRLITIIRDLSEKNRLPCIYFAFGRKRCEQLANEIFNFNFLEEEEKKKITQEFFTLLARFDLLNEKSAVNMIPFIERGIAYHHAGMLPTLKESIEQLFTSKLIKIIFTTETFSLGINMPARTVVFDEIRKFYGKFHTNLKTRDFYQMAGRAGRRGIDTEGFVYIKVNPHQIADEDLKRIIYSQPEKVKSRFNASYATLLNLYEKYGEKLYDIYPLSFHCFQEKIKYQERAIFSIKSKIKVLKDLGYIEGNSLTDKGKFASNIYGYELSFTELYEIGLIEHLTEIELGILILALVFEPRKGMVLPKISKDIRHLAETTEEVIHKVHRKEINAGISPLSKIYYFHLSPILTAWMKGENFEHIMRLSDVDEGEVIRYFRMSIQILKEILEIKISFSFQERIKKVIDLINRDIVDAEKQLRS
ncbi:ATP-dependent RNA helicase DOB1 [Candidatus Omnitrophus magneticus]|uniref:ATP-dependent RNA helicase DOB1 n=1 Tax=Candidatus Omnitrophus magneticus TaxID=1609969 RepID=A0A0F0CWJ1_9BACT|nr:ATP-dependent RNA helicase DOB1 [Candidatus Omnitrophus magneticus]